MTALEELEGSVRALGPAAVLQRHAGARIDWSTFWSTERGDSEWLVEPLLPLRRSVATYSPAKTGKSLLALDVAARVATGQRVLDRPAGSPLRVVYLDAEMTEDDLHERLDDLGYGPADDLSRLAYYLLPSLPPLDAAEGGQELRELAAAHEADLVVLDTTSRVLGGNENDADTMRAFYRHTGAPLKADQRTVWRLDHAGKDLERGQRGTSAKADDVDVVWELTARDGGSLRLRATHRRLAWVPEVLDLIRCEDPLRHERLEDSWPAGTAECARALDRLEVPVEHGGRRVRKALRGAGVQVRNEVIAAAIRYRRDVSPTARDTSPAAFSGHVRGHVLNQAVDQQGNGTGTRPDTSAAAEGAVGVSLLGDTPALPEVPEVPS